MLPLINYDSPNEIRSLLEERSLGMRKRYGQNFLINCHARETLLDSLELPPGAEVWEIGAGIGAMTKGLLERGAKLTVFEIDPGFSGILKELFGSMPSFRLIEGDVMKTWQITPNASTESKDCNEIYLFGNLPYNIASAILADFIEKGRFFKRIVVTVQREVAVRMAASPGTKDYSSFSVLCSSAYKVTPLNVLKPSFFYPAPRVESQGVRLDLLPGTGMPESGAVHVLFTPLVRFLFSSRRKTIRNSLTAFISSGIVSKRFACKNTFNCKNMLTPKEAAELALKKAGLSGDRRPETLSIEEFSRLAFVLEEIFA